MIQRYSPDSVYHVRTGTVTNVDLVPDVDGEAVLFEDHIAAVTPPVFANDNHSALLSAVLSVDPEDPAARRD